MCNVGREILFFCREGGGFFLFFRGVDINTFGGSYQDYRRKLSSMLLAIVIDTTSDNYPKVV